MYIFWLNIISSIYGITVVNNFIFFKGSIKEIKVFLFVNIAKNIFPVF